MNDNHTFKWIDEALLNEIETLSSQIASLEQAVKEKIMFEKMKMKLKK